MKLGERLAALVAQLREGLGSIEAKHEQRTTPARISEICPFRESFLRELASKDEATFRSFGAYLIRRFAAEDQGPNDEKAPTLLGDTEGIFAEVRNLELMCAFVVGVSSEGDATEEEVIELIRWAGVFLGAIGGEGVAYHEAAPVSGGSYRTTTVYMYDDNVLYLDAGEWLEYTIDVERAGVYTLVAQVGAEQPGGSFHVELDGVNVTGPIAVPNTGVWNHWGSAIKAGVSFPAGRHVLRVASDSWFDSFYSLRIVVAQAPFGGTVRTFPGTVKAADFDEGGEQISYHDTTADCQGSCGYRLADVDRWDEVVWHTASGEWMEYTVDVTASGTYTLALRVGAEDGGAIFHVEFNGVNVTGPLTVPTTGGWNVFQTVTKTGVSLTAGRKVMRIVIDDSAGAYDAGSFDTISIQP